MIFLNFLKLSERNNYFYKYFSILFKSFFMSLESLSSLKINSDNHRHLRSFDNGLVI